MTLETVGLIVWVAVGVVTVAVYAAVATIVVRDVLDQRRREGR